MQINLSTLPTVSKDSPFDISSFPVSSLLIILISFLSMYSILPIPILGHQVLQLQTFCFFRLFFLFFLFFFDFLIDKNYDEQMHVTEEVCKNLRRAVLSNHRIGVAQ